MSGIRFLPDPARPGVAHLILNRPEARNAQTPAMWAELARIGADLDPSLRIIIVRGEGAGFSSGLDRALLTPEGLDGESLSSLAMGPQEAAQAFIARAQQAFSWLPSAPVISIAAVHGHAIGAGFQLALACDLVIAAESAQFAMRETSLGIVPDLGGTWPLVRALGYGPALELCATGRSMGGAEAASRGFALRCVPDDGLTAAVESVVDAILAAPEGAVRELTGLLRTATQVDRAAQLDAEQAAQLRRFAEFRAAAGLR